MSEVQLNRRKQLSGYSVASLIQPDIQKKTSKNFVKKNQKFIETLELKNKENSKPVPEKKPFKLAQFDNVPSRIHSRSSTPKTSNATINTNSSIRNGKNFLALNKQSVINGTSPHSSNFNTRPSSTSSSSSTMNNLSSSKDLNLITSSTPSSSNRSSRLNILSSKEQETTGAAGPKIHSLGKLPTYLVKRKLEWAKQEEERLKKLEEIHVPSGMKLLTQEEKQENLDLLLAHRGALMKQLSQLSITADSRKFVAKKHALERDLEQTEESVKIFEKDHVFVELD